MGAATAAFVFDYRRFANCVVPPVRALLQTGRLGPWLTEVWRVNNPAPRRKPPMPFPTPPEPPNPTVFFSPTT